MATKKCGGEANSRKRKSYTPTRFVQLPMQLQQNNHVLPPINHVSTDLRLNIHNHSDGLFSHMNKPFTSFTSLLMGSDTEAENEHLALVKQYTENVNAVVNTQTEIMRCTLEGLWDRQQNALIKAVEESDAMKLKEKEAEIKQLQEEVAYHKTEVQWWKGRAESMETSLRAAMQKLQVSGEGTSGGALRRQGTAVLEEDAASSHVDSDKVEPVKLKCRVCKSRVATVMVWPCRHLCMCISCDPLVKICMVCHTPKDKSMEVRLSGEI